MTNTTPDWDKIMAAFEEIANRHGPVSTFEEDSLPFSVELPEVQSDNYLGWTWRPSFPECLEPMGCKRKKEKMEVSKKIPVDEDYKFDVCLWKLVDDLLDESDE
ncbi:PTPN14_21 [Lepeophtheirus salmonis]|uniref:PTPN14_21 n=1 Tax=Lepeophtheirus salmonis TaxID=72036 RepID=A0A0K2V5G0_LEPSM|nr:PTPN14_21 [Lepeophtheirus salmonis]CAF2906310.1 PTPN14_21 [Lepeophtheirus salmonis]